jgi:predicted Kef-type K+ transport protein
MKNRSTLPLHEAWIIFFFLGMVMLNYPFLHIFNKGLPIFGVPLILIYLMVGWPLSILVVYLFSINLRNEPPTLNGKSNSEPRPEGKK